MEKMKTVLNITLKKEKRICTGQKGKKTILAAEWIDPEMIKNLKLRSKMNRNWRYARKNELAMEVQEEYKEEYLKQKKKTAIMAGDKKSNWEKRKIEETWYDGKKFWTMVRELLGKKKEREEEAHVYTEEGERKEIMKIQENFIGKWQKSIYQKASRPDFSFWYGEGGKMEKMIEEGKRPESGIMEFPTIE